MNYLAHVFLSSHTPPGFAGALLGDFVKGGGIPDRWGVEVQAGIRLHRAIDRYTDRHPLVRASCALIRPERRRFAGVVVDMIYDHFLARHWSRYCARPLEEFTQEVYRVLLLQQAVLPARLQHILPWMVQDDWLGAYADIESVAAAFRGIAQRLRFPERAQPLMTAVDDLARDYSTFETHFSEFFPELQRFAQTQRDIVAGELAG